MSNRRKLRGRDWEPLSRRLQSIQHGHETQLRAEIEQARPGFLDQADAAVADGIRLTRQLRANLKNLHPDDSAQVDARRIPARIRSQVHGLFLRVTTELAAGERARCGHISLDAPSPAVVPVYENWASCPRCLPRMPHAALTEREDHTCDLCGTYKPQQTMDHIYPQVGPFILIIGICPACSAPLKAAAQ